MKSKDEPLAYRVYVLRSWQVGLASDCDAAVWRFSLEDPITRQRLGFADVEALTRFLVAEFNRDLEGCSEEARG